jgi:hypothetical protein
LNALQTDKESTENYVVPSEAQFERSYSSADAKSIITSTIAARFDVK